MRRRFTIQPTEVRQYYREGYLLKKRFVPEGLLRQAIDASQNLTEQKYLNIKDYDPIRITADLLSTTTGFASLLTSLNLWGAVSSLLGSKHLVYHFSSLTIKKPGQEGVARWQWGFVNQYPSPVNSDFVRVFIPLTTFNPSSEALKIIRQSNRVADETVKLSKRLNSPCTRKFPAEQPLYCSPGDIVFINPKTRHCSGNNDSDSDQVNLVMQVGIAKSPVTHSAENKGLFGAGRLKLHLNGG